MTRIRRGLLAAVVCLATASASREAAAAGFATQHFGGEQGTVLSTNPTAVYYNPGAIGFSEGIHLYLDGDIAMRHATWTHQAPPPGAQDQPDSQVGNSGTAHLFNVFAGPAMAATLRVGNFAFGVGLFVPFGGRVNWSTTDPNPKYPFTAGGVQRWHQIDAALTFVQASAGMAYRLGPVSIGATGNFINSQINDDQAKASSGYIDTTAEERANLNVKGNNGSYAVGAMVEAIPRRLWLGASYQAQPGLGAQTLKGTFTLTTGAAPNYAPSPPLVQKVDFHQSLPDVIRGGIRFAVTPGFELRAYGDYTRWSKMTSQCINTQVSDSCLVHADGSAVGGGVVANLVRDWKDTFSAHLGTSVFVSPEVEVFGGVGYETGAEPDATVEPGTMDGNNISASLGGRFFIAHYLYFAASYTQLQFLNRTVTDSQLATLPNGQPVAQPTYQQDGNGTYTQWVGVFDINIEKQF
jgi:long-chain fatty acid transport protein